MDYKEKRDEYSKDILSNPEKYRRELKNILGWHLTEAREKANCVSEEKLLENNNFSIYRLEQILLSEE